MNHPRRDAVDTEPGAGGPPPTPTEARDQLRREWREHPERRPEIEAIGRALAVIIDILDTKD